MNQEIGFVVTHRFDGVNISDSEFGNLLDIVSWKQQPVFPRRGRMAWHIFDEVPSLISNSSYQLRAAKIKGVGAYNPPVDGRFRDPLLDYFLDEPIPPTTEPLDSFVTYPHLGFSKEGGYTFVYGSLSPVGGIVHERAHREYNMAQILLEHGVPTIVPMAVVQYEERLTFQGQPMGAVISLVPDTDPYRLSEVQYGASVQRGEEPAKDAYYDRIRQSLGVEGDPSSETTRLETMNILSRKVGKLIHDFTKAGLYRYSPEYSNFEYNFDHQEVVLTDLDSTRVMSELSDEHRRLQALRDLSSVVYRLVSKFGTPSTLDQYTITNLLKYDPLTELLIGYFPDASEEVIKTHSIRLWNAFIPYFFLLKRHKNEIRNEWENERRRSYKMDHDLFYILVMTSLYPLFCQSDLSELYPWPALTQGALMKKAEKYLGERYEYFLYLLDSEV